MNSLVGIIRKEEEITEALDKLTELRERYKRVTVDGDRPFNPGWHLAIDLRNMLLVSECIAKAALERTESRGGHTRDDHPSMESDWRKTLLVCRTEGDPKPSCPRSASPSRTRSRCARTCSTCSSSPSWRSTSPTAKLAQHPERSN